MRVLIADDHRLMVEGTKQALEKAGGFEVVGEAVNGVQVLPLVRRLKPQLVLLDLRMPQMDGLTCLSKIRKEFPDVKVAILSVSQDPELIQTALKRGANAYIVRRSTPTTSREHCDRRSTGTSSRPPVSPRIPANAPHVMPD